MHVTGNFNYTWLLQVTGTPAPASRFEEWTGDSPSSSSNPVVVTMSADKAVTGEFAEIATLMVTTNATGVLPVVMSLETPPILVADPVNSGVYYAPAGDEVEVDTLTTASNMAFIRWEDEEAELLDTDTTTTVLMGAEPLLHAKYGAQVVVTATIANLPGGGTVHGSLGAPVVLNAAEGYAAYNAPATLSATQVLYFYPAGTILEFTAEPDEDYCLHPWDTGLDNFCATGTTVELPPLTASMPLTASFSPCKTLTTEVLGPSDFAAPIAVAVANGRGVYCELGTDSTYELAQGVQIRLTATEEVIGTEFEPGWYFFTWLGDDAVKNERGNVVKINSLSDDTTAKAWYTSDLHSADTNAGDDDPGVVTLSELLRVIQFYNSQGYHCAGGTSTEDGYLPGSGGEDCAPHNSDYPKEILKGNETLFLDQDWVVSLSELLRLIQFYNIGNYHVCPEANQEDGYCPGEAP